MMIMIVKSSPWTVKEFETSLHPEYAAIRNLVRTLRSNFVLVGIGGRRYQHFGHPTLDLSFYNVATSNAILSLLSYPALLGLVVALRPQVVVTMGMFVQIPAQLGADMVGAHHVSAVIGEPFYLSRQMRPLCKIAKLHFFLNIALKRARSVLAISERVRQDIAKITRSTVDVSVYHYTLPDIFRPGLQGTLKVPKGFRGRVVLTSCQISRRKGLDLIVLAAPLVLRKIPEAIFVIRGPIGDAKYFSELSAMIRREGLGEQVMLMNEMRAYEDLPGILSSADVFVHPSRDESLGLSIAEALACGVPVIATRVGGIPELVKHMVNGLLVEPDPVLVSDAIVRILSDTGLRDHLRKGAREFSEQIRRPKDSDFGRMLEMRIREVTAQ